MKLKYYLRGIGVGVVITTILFMILIPLHKSDTKSQDTVKQNTESKTVADLKEETQTETEEKSDTQTPSGTESEQKEKQDTKKQDTKDSDTSNASKEDTPKESPKNSETETAKQETKPEEKPQEKIRIEISGGEFSDDICRKLEKTGLIDNAEAFNRFLIEKDYDNSIMPGLYEIPKDSTYEQIATLLTTKVE